MFRRSKTQNILIFAIACLFCRQNGLPFSGYQPLVAPPPFPRPHHNQEHGWGEKSSSFALSGLGGNSEDMDGSLSLSQEKHWAHNTVCVNQCFCDWKGKIYIFRILAGVIGGPCWQKIITWFDENIHSHCFKPFVLLLGHHDDKNNMKNSNWMGRDARGLIPAPWKHV